MISVAIGSGVTSMPTAPTIDDGSAEALQAICDYEIACTLRALRGQGYTLSQAESTDFSAAESAFDAFGAQLKTWVDGAVDASAQGTEPTAFDPEYLPDIITFIALLATQNWGAIFVLFVKVGLRFVLDDKRKELDPGTSTGETADMLRDLFAVLDTEGNIVGSKLEGLANLQILINNILSQGEQDALYKVGAMQS